MIKSYGLDCFSLKSCKIVQLYRNVFIVHHNKSKVLNETRPLQQNFYLTFIQVNRVDVLLVENTSKIQET